MVVAQTDIQNNNNNNNDNNTNRADETADGIQLKIKPNSDHPQVNTPNQHQSINSSTHQNDSGNKINNESKPQQMKSTDVCANDDNEEKILAELFNRKQLLLQRLSEEMEKYEQLCWEEMAITRNISDQSFLPLNHLNVRSNSETRNPFNTTPRVILDQTNNTANCTNRSRGIAARLKFRNSRRSKSAHERIPESPYRLFQRNTAELSPTRRSLTDNLLDDNSENSKKSWKWWRTNKDRGGLLNSGVRRRQSIGMIAEQYFRYFTNDKSEHSRGGSLPPRDNNTNNGNNSSTCKNETKQLTPSVKLDVNKRQSLHLEEFLQFLSAHQQNNSNNNMESSHLGTYPPPHNACHLYQHHHYHHHHHEPQQRQFQPQVDRSLSQPEAYVLAPKCICSNELQQVTCNNHQRQQHFTGFRTNEPLFYSSQRNPNITTAYNGHKKIYDSCHHIQRNPNNTKRQSTHINGALNNQNTLYGSPSSSAYTSQVKLMPGMHLYSLQKNNSSLGTTGSVCPGSFIVCTVPPGTTTPFPVPPTHIQSIQPTSSSTPAPPIPPRIHGRTSIMLNHSSKSMEESVLSKTIDESNMKIDKSQVNTTQHIIISEMDKSVNPINNICIPVTRKTGTTVNLVPYSSRWPTGCGGGGAGAGGEKHAYFNCMASRQHNIKSNFPSNCAFKETISSPQKNPVNNGPYKTNYAVKPIHQHFQQPQQQLPSKVTNYPQPLSNSTHQVLLSKSNQKQSLNGNLPDMSKLNKADLLNLTHCNNNSNNNSARNYDRYSSQIRKSIKTTEPLNTRIQSIQSVANSYPQWIVRNQFSSNKDITNEPFLVYQLNQPKKKSSRNNPQVEFDESKNSPSVSSPSSSSSSTAAAAAAAAVAVNQMNSTSSTCNNVKNHSVGWEINLGCAYNNNNTNSNNGNNKSVPVHYITPVNFKQCWQQTREPSLLVNRNQSQLSSTPKTSHSTTPLQSTQYPKTLVDGYSSVQKKLFPPNCQQEFVLHNRHHSNNHNNINSNSTNHHNACSNSNNNQSEHPHYPNHR
ncbi:unnamed protein product [Trichobilharzia szidati]|nr:unnamed protein product [Trichobilharzia szidati]